ncbi:SDR family oxidoreductase [Spirosoma sp. BT702]|uniref:SDR family oxidoreductase n=1 Tax=Spirosoma profusum TaxID=2771354 RepID=A0A926XXW8_9BACT|nr:SDR family oxidoreductase [Spirosoma profusum]MBD2700037.1 SDR family oxidoreductase [Spirosoma profusum]
MENQTKKTALITGASSGIGRELARLFAKDGYKLVVVGRNTELLEQLANTHTNQYGTETVIIQKDLADPNAPEEIYAETQSKGIQVDVLVNDAGFGEYGQFATETDLQKELNVVQVNAVALMHLTKLYVKDMVARQDGKILMLGSEVSVVPNPMMAVYGATKAFIKSFSEAIRNELQGTNVTVTVLMPGATNTNFFNVAGASDIKGADPAKTANPADVAKEGYEALMQGKDHVVAGWMNKARVAVAHILPDPLLAANARRDMAPKDESGDQQKERGKQFAVGLGLVAGVVAGLFLTYRQTSSYDRMRYRYKANQAGKAAKKALGNAADSVKGVYQKAQEVAEEQFA